MTYYRVHKDERYPVYDSFDLVIDPNEPGANRDSVYDLPAGLVEEYRCALKRFENLRTTVEELCHAQNVRDTEKHPTRQQVNNLTDALKYLVTHPGGLVLLVDAEHDGNIQLTMDRE